MRNTDLRWSKSRQSIRTAHIKKILVSNVRKIRAIIIFYRSELGKQRVFRVKNK